METIKTSQAFKSGLIELDIKCGAAKKDFDNFLHGCATALSIPVGYKFNVTTLDFDPPKNDVEDKPAQ